MPLARLPFAPRPYSDETLSSWLGRIGCRYGMTARELTASFAEGEGAAPVDDVDPGAANLQQWAWRCGVDPARLRCLALTDRYRNRSTGWFLTTRIRERREAAVQGIPICLACIGSDRAAGRDSYLRSHWLLAEHCICLRHRQPLIDRCPQCWKPLRPRFRLRDGLARLACRSCETDLTDPTAEWALQDDTVIKAATGIQRQIAAFFDAGATMRRLEVAISDLWAPLHDPGAARPVLALWLRSPGWHCPLEASWAIGAQAPLACLPVRWRVITLVALVDVLGEQPACREERLPEAEALFRHAAPRRSIPRWPIPVGNARPSLSVDPRQGQVARDYARLARDLVAHPDWIAAEGKPAGQRRRIHNRLMDVALSGRAVSGSGSSGDGLHESSTE